MINTPTVLILGAWVANRVSNHCIFLCCWVTEYRILEQQVRRKVSPERSRLQFGGSVTVDESPHQAIRHTL
jgi:hypothetical protein